MQTKLLELPRCMRPARAAVQIATALLILSVAWTSPTIAQTIPTDAQPTCTVTPAMFKSWFQGGVVKLNGSVLPANSVTFPNTPNCSFYQWSMQMFLWLTSPSPVSYGGSGRVFDTSVFFDISPPDQNGERTFVPHFPGMIRSLNVRAAQPGAAGFPVLFAKNGKLLQVAPPELGPTGKPLIRDSVGNLVEIERSTLDANQHPLFMDKAGKPIEHQLTGKALRIRQAQVQPSGALVVRKFIINGKPVFIDPFGNEVETEEGQAGDDGVLQAQTSSLVYYISMTNDVYAYFLTGVKNNKITPGTQFPVNQSDLSQITAYAAANGKTLPDANALAIELKTAWVEAGNLPNLNNYITMSATIPTYDQSNPNQWVPNGSKTVELALAGVHVVGSTAGHPEMLWATFEHFGNAPPATYTYNSTSGMKTVTQNTAGTWLLTANNAAGPFNVANMQYQSPNIVAFTGHTISPSDTLRSKAWGAASDVSPNPIDGSTTASNTEIISINHSVGGMMPNGDVRNNYFMTGATWTIGGAPPTATNQVGTSQLANTTMETFQQGPDNTVAHGSSNCFDCHTSSSTTISTTAVSHIFKKLKPLF